jgi:hypothetical protein
MWKLDWLRKRKKLRRRRGQLRKQKRKGFA